MEVISREGLTVKQFQTGCLSQFAYMISAGGVSVVIDPIRDIEDYLKTQNVYGDIKYIVETHYHADFVSGHVDLAEKTQAEIINGSTEFTPDQKVERDGVTFGRKIELGDYTLWFLNTPGHTLESVSIFLESPEKEMLCVFTGDTLFLGDVGRPDLAQKGNGPSSEELASLLFDSCQLIKRVASNDTVIYPGHGAGSSCGKNISSGTSCTIGTQLTKNIPFSQSNKEDFIKIVTSDLPTPPSYFYDSVAKNKQEGIKSVDQIITQAQSFPANDIEKYVKDTGVWIIDTRPSEEFKAGHIPGSVSVPLGGNFAIWSAYLVHASEGILLVTPKGKEEEAMTRLARTGLDNILGYLEGGYEAWASNKALPVESVSDLNFNDSKEFEQLVDGYKVFDVREPGEVRSAGLYQTAEK